MDKFVILADITCDLTKEIREFVGMQDYIKGHVSITEDGETKDYQTDLDWQTLTRETFYGVLDKKNVKVVSAPPNLDEYMDAFTKYVEQGYAVLRGTFCDGDTVEILYDCPIVVYEAHPYVKEVRGLVAIKHGPTLYCAEEIDNQQIPADDFQPTLAADLSPVRNADGTPFDHVANVRRGGAAFACSRA